MAINSPWQLEVPGTGTGLLAAPAAPAAASDAPKTANMMHSLVNT